MQRGYYLTRLSRKRKVSAVATPWGQLVPERRVPKVQSELRPLCACAKSLEPRSDAIAQPRDLFRVTMQVRDPCIGAI